MDFDTLLGQMETQRPDLSDSLSLLRQFHKTKQNAANNEDVNVQTETEHIMELQTLLEKQRSINRNLIKQYERLKDNYELLIGQMDEIANATGACPHCWGEESTCNYCRGRGKPGSFFPDQQNFDIYIKPVILKLKNNKSTINN